MSRNVTAMFYLPDVITAEYFDTVEPFSRESIWQLCYRDLREQDVRIESKTALSELCFNDDTIFPETLADMADSILRAGKEHRLNGDSLTGKGIKLAVIDRPINRYHREFTDRIEYIEVFSNHPDMDYQDFHGMVCASFLCGSTCGIAKDAELVYFAIPNRTNPVGEYYSFQLEALRRILKYNQTNADPIRAVSLSAPFLKEQMGERDKLAEELRKSGCELIDATMFGREFSGIDCRLYEDGERYCLNAWQKENYERNKARPGFVDYWNNLVWVPSSRRSSASNDRNDSYIHWSKAVSESWTIPHVVGAYALCLEKHSSLTFERFSESARACPEIDGRRLLNVGELELQGFNI